MSDHQDYDAPMTTGEKVHFWFWSALRPTYDPNVHLDYPGSPAWRERHDRQRQQRRKKG